VNPNLRAEFNRAWTPDLYRRVRDDLERRLGCGIPFPMAESPLFLTPELRVRLQDTANEIMAQLVQPDFIDRAEATIPDRWKGPGRGRLPQLAVVDLAIVEEENGSLGCRVVELQGFPSLYCFQILLADVWATALADVPGMPDWWLLFFSDIDRYHAMSMLRKAIIGDNDPREVVLLDFRTEHQKTYPDFAATQRWFGVDPVCVTELIRDGDKLYRRMDGRLHRVRRIYQRIVFDELERLGGSLPFDPHEVMDVEWAPHPEWYFLWSKVSLLELDHPAVPKTIRLTELDGIPDDLENWVLKPLYSFAGTGVVIDPTPEDVAKVPEEDAYEWVLQEKIEYAPAFHNPDGQPVRAELRMMFIRPDDQDEMTLLLNLGRLSRGKMIGVDHNQGLLWTGATVGIWEA
jgi:hypothetical protein